MADVVGAMASIASVLLNISPIKDVRGEQASKARFHFVPYLKFECKAKISHFSRCTTF